MCQNVCACDKPSILPDQLYPYTFVLDTTATAQVQTVVICICYRRR